MNELQYESSPYLLQHAQNPVHWKAWNEKSLALAQQENKLIIVSIGYSTCHWCHVMEHESFEDQEVARLMNDSFVCIKVDREERPDIDAYFMKAVQLLSQRGGWPLNMVCLPDGKPVWGGTYFRKKDWMESLSSLQSLYETKPEDFHAHAKSLSEGVAGASKAPIIEQSLDPFDREDFVDSWTNYFDRLYGGYGREPKFMIPNSLLFLQRYGYLKEDKIVLDFIDLTLTRMAWGGLFDTVQGGFSRYSVDKRWHVPHFEKMLYDNAQLLSLYADGYKRTKNPLYKEVIEKTVRFILDEWSNGEGGFYSAYDADSLDKHGHLKEGAYYSWTEEELQAIIPVEDYPLFTYLFNINSRGHWEDGEYVLIQTEELSEVASEHSLSLDEVRKKKVIWEALLREERIKRQKPRLDDKTLTSWNALLVVGLLDAYTALKEESYLSVAKSIMHFMRTKLQVNGRLMHTYKEGTATIDGFLEDYAFYMAALIALYEHTLDTAYLKEAKEVVDRVIKDYLDEESGFFFFNNKHQATVLHNSIETEDGVIPSGNSQMTNNLLKLGLLFEEVGYTSIADKMLETMKTHFSYGPYYSNWLLADLYQAEPSELLVSGEKALDEVLTIKEQLIGKSLVLGAKELTDIPYFQGKFKPNKTQYYFCSDRVCMAPQESNEFLLNQKL